MIRPCRILAGLIFVGAATFSLAQTPMAAQDRSENSTLLELSRKIDQQNIKIDLLSQQILRLQQQIEHPRTSALGETSHHSTETTPPANTAGAGGNTHVVAKGETLTSIARQHKVTIGDLQKINHIEDDRKLQIGQTLILPPGAASAALSSPSPSSSPNE
jgi:LysM repeat protein